METLMAAKGVRRRSFAGTRLKFVVVELWQLM
jgi:hypothetical protein